jgi:hypothetical protein
MKAIIRRASLCVASLVLGLFATHATAQTIPAVQGTSIADPAVPVLITPAPTGSGFFVLNQDYTLLQHSTVDTSQNESCPAPSIFSTTNTAERTLVTDLYNAYVSGADAPGLSLAVTAITPEVSCQTMKPSTTQAECLLYPWLQMTLSTQPTIWSAPLAAATWTA